MSARQPSSASGIRKQHVPTFEDFASEELNARLNASETMLRGRIGDQKVDDLIVQFIEAGKADPALFTALYKKRDPYRWLAQHWAPKQRAKEIH